MKVLVATPLGRGGKGGIDRIMDDVREELAVSPPDDLEVEFVTTRGQGHIALSPFYFGAAIVKLIRARLTRQVDVLHINLSSHGSTRRKLLIAIAAKRLGIPYIIHLHGSRYRQFWQAASPAEARYIHAMFAGAARILVLGNVWSDFVVKKVPDAKARITILPNASRAPAQPARPDPKQVTILFLGQVGVRKGVPHLIDALGQLSALPNWRAIIAGNGDLATMQAQVNELTLDERIEFTGWVGPERVTELLSTSDILVLPSFDENLPMSVIEGMAHGLAVVTTPVGAVEDIITDGKTGLLVPPGDVESLAQALHRLIADPLLRIRLGRQARDFHRQQLDIGSYVVRLTDIWRAIAISAR